MNRYDLLFIVLLAITPALISGMLGIRPWKGAALGIASIVSFDVFYYIFNQDLYFSVPITVGFILIAADTIGIGLRNTLVISLCSVLLSSVIVVTTGTIADSYERSSQHSVNVAPKASSYTRRINPTFRQSIPAIDFVGAWSQYNGMEITTGPCQMTQASPKTAACLVRGPEGEPGIILVDIPSLEIESRRKTLAYCHEFFTEPQCMVNKISGRVSSIWPVPLLTGSSIKWGN